MKRLLVITGPTASGKSELALNTAKLVNGEIISADSVQVYKGLDIGSAKPPLELRENIPHHLISILNPTMEFNTGIFRNTALNIIKDINLRNHQPIIVGGTGLYIKSLLDGLADIPDIPDHITQQVDAKIIELRANSESESCARTQFHNWLKILDSKSAASLNTQDLLRTRRAAIVALSTGQSIVNIVEKSRLLDSSLFSLAIVLCPARPYLYAAIDTRVDRMIDLGLVKEVEEILQQNQLDTALSFGGIQSLPKSLNSIGYRHVCMFLNREITLDRMIELIKRDTRRFAKRQLTWWRNEPNKLCWQSLREEYSRTSTLHTIDECIEWSKDFLNLSIQQEQSWAEQLNLSKNQMSGQLSKVQYLTVGSGLENL